MAGIVGLRYRSYARVDLLARALQVRAARNWILGRVEGDLASLRVAEARLAEQLQRPLTNCRVLEIGPGQGRERARFLARYNDVSCLDLDAYPSWGQPSSIVEALRVNGWQRTAKALGRELFVERRNRAAWDAAMGPSRRSEPKALLGDVCAAVPAPGTWDAVVSWSVFEHLVDPERAVANVVTALRPGGAFLIEVHLWTAHNGHHDLRSCVGDDAMLPFFAHLRPRYAHLVRPSSYLNRWRLDQWRALFDRLAPGCREVLARLDYDDWPDGLREELGEYRDEELLTVTAQYLWRKPERDASPLTAVRP
jgi:SAM-dependent methyltransferase